MLVAAQASLFLFQLPFLYSIVPVLLYGFCYLAFTFTLNAMPGSRLTYYFSGPLFMLTILGAFLQYNIEYSRRRNFLAIRNIKEETEKLAAEERTNTFLLQNVLPVRILEEMTDLVGTAESQLVQRYDHVTVMFCLIKGFNELHLPHDKLLEKLNLLITAFDALLDDYAKVEKIKTIGPVYMVASGCPERNALHAADVVELALLMRDAVDSFSQKEQLGVKLQAQIGINSGPVVGGIVGKKRFLFDIFGDTVNVASRLETNGTPGRILVSQSTRLSLEKQRTRHTYEDHPVVAKGKTEPIAAYFIKDSLADSQLVTPMKGKAVNWELVDLEQSSTAFQRITSSTTRHNSSLAGGMASITESHGALPRRSESPAAPLAAGSDVPLGRWGDKDPSVSPINPRPQVSPPITYSTAATGTTSAHTYSNHRTPATTTTTITSTTKNPGPAPRGPAHLHLQPSVTSFEEAAPKKDALELSTENRHTSVHHLSVRPLTPNSQSDASMPALIPAQPPMLRSTGSMASASSLTSSSRFQPRDPNEPRQISKAVLLDTLAKRKRTRLPGEVELADTSSEDRSTLSVNTSVRGQPTAHGGVKALYAGKKPPRTGAMDVAGILGVNKSVGDVIRQTVGTSSPLHRIATKPLINAAAVGRTERGLERAASRSSLAARSVGSGEPSQLSLLGAPVTSLGAGGVGHGSPHTSMASLHLGARENSEMLMEKLTHADSTLSTADMEDEAEEIVEEEVDMNKFAMKKVSLSFKDPRVEQDFRRRTDWASMISTRMLMFLCVGFFALMGGADLGAIPRVWWARILPPGSAFGILCQTVLLVITALCRPVTLPIQAEVLGVVSFTLAAAAILLRVIVAAFVSPVVLEAVVFYRSHTLLSIAYMGSFSEVRFVKTIVTLICFYVLYVVVAAVTSSHLKLLGVLHYDSLPVLLSIVLSVLASRYLESAARLHYALLKVSSEAHAGANDLKAVSDRLLLNVLPPKISDMLKTNPKSVSLEFEMATMLFCDIVSFTNFSSDKSPQEVVSLLNAMFSEFDDLTDPYEVEKIKTIGDCYVAGSGMLNEDITSGEAALNLCRFALAMLDVVRHVGARYNMQVRIGIHSGPVVAGVVGRKKFLWDVWGETVDVAEAMESMGIAMRIHVSSATQKLVADEFGWESGVAPRPGTPAAAFKTFLLVSQLTEPWVPPNFLNRSISFENDVTPIAIPASSPTPAEHAPPRQPALAPGEPGSARSRGTENARVVRQRDDGRSESDGSGSYYTPSESECEVRSRRSMMSPGSPESKLSATGRRRVRRQRSHGSMSKNSTRRGKGLTVNDLENHEPTPARRGRRRSISVAEGEAKAAAAAATREHMRATGGSGSNPNSPPVVAVLPRSRSDARPPRARRMSSVEMANPLPGEIDTPPRRRRRTLSVSSRGSAASTGPLLDHHEGSASVVSPRAAHGGQGGSHAGHNGRAGSASSNRSGRIVHQRSSPSPVAAETPSSGRLPRTVSLDTRNVGFGPTQYRRSFEKHSAIEEDEHSVMSDRGARRRRGVGLGSPLGTPVNSPPGFDDSNDILKDYG